MSLKPLADRIVVEKAEEEKKTAGGIIIPDSHSEKPSVGTILSIGKDVQELKVGDKVYFGKYAGTEIKVGDKAYLILIETDVLAVLS